MSKEQQEGDASPRVCHPPREPPRRQALLVSDMTVTTTENEMGAPGTQASVTHKSRHSRVSNNTPPHCEHLEGQTLAKGSARRSILPVDLDPGSGERMPSSLRRRGMQERGLGVILPRARALHLINPPRPGEQLGQAAE